MRRGNTNWKWAGASALAVGLALGAGQEAEAASIIYSETFDAPYQGTTGDGTDPLNGTTPDTTTGGNTWIASSDWLENGTPLADIASAGNADDNAYLEFTPEAGKIYTLGADIETTQNAWLALGFSRAANTTVDFWASANSPTAWVLVRETGEVDSFSGDSGQGGGNPGLGGNVDLGIHAEPVSLAIVLDTTGAQWTAEWFVDGSSERNFTYTTGNPTDITHVGFGRTGSLAGGSLGTVDNFSLTVVPEPGSLALLGLGGLLVAARRRRD